MDERETRSPAPPAAGDTMADARMAAIFAHMQEGAALHELVFGDRGSPVDYRILNVNARYEELLGRRRGDVVGRLASEVYGAEAASFLTQFVDVLREGKARHLDVQAHYLNRRVSILVVPLDSLSFATLLSDVGFAHDQADAIEKSRLAQRALLDNQPHLAWLKDRESRFLTVNRAFAQACGQPDPDAITGKTDFDVWPRELAEAYRADDRAVMEAGTQKMVEEQIAGVDGTRWFETYKSPVFDPDGTIVGTTGISRDITHRKLVELALREAERAAAKSRERLLYVSQLAHIGHFAMNLQTGTISWTPELFRIFGQDPKTFEPAADAVRAMILPDYRTVADDAIRTAIDTRQTQRFHFRIAKPDGDIRHCVAIVEVDDATPTDAVFGMVQDLTDLRRAEEERRRLEQQVMHAQKLESLGVLAGGIAHDFNNLLTSILGNADLAQIELPPTSPVLPYLESIEQVSRRAAELCRQMLAYSGKGRFVVQPTSLNTVVKEMGQLLGVSINKNAVIKYDFHPDLPSVMADATQMRQVVMNLITNAAEAIGDMSGMVTLATGVMDCDGDDLKGMVGDTAARAPGRYVFLQVSDTGCGMDKATLARIFDPFFTTKFTGRGLGLAAVLGIVRGHNGAMRVDSEKGKGTVFKILLPAHDQAAQPQQCACDAAADWRSQGVVLLADDEESIRSLGRKLLERVGFDVLVARDGREALDLFGQNLGRIRLVVLDMTMPRLDGEACYRELRRLNPDVKVIMSSGYNEQEVISHFIGQGLAGFVQKPYKSADLIGIIRKVLEPST
jgi:PAS domain S-box-containing protein